MWNTKKGQYVDIHSHILSEIDDGAVDIEQSTQMLQVAYENNIGSLIVTPHNKADRHSASRDTILHKVRELQHISDSLHYGIKLHTGNELYYREELPDLLEQGKVCTLAESLYVLIEFSPMDDFGYMRDGLYHMITAGYRPVIAHIERYQCLIGKSQRLEELIGMGCYLQVNAGSIVGDYGFTVKRYTKMLLKQRDIHLVATDAHNAGKRAPCMQHAADLLYRKYDADYVDGLLFGNAAKIIENDYI